MKIFKQVTEDSYVHNTDLVVNEFITREFGRSPNGNWFNGSWVYRDEQGNYIDHDRYRTDLAERLNVQLVSFNM